MSLVTWVAAVFALLAVLIIVHEFGHFLAAKLFDVKVIRVSLGFGPRLVGFTAGEVEYRLSLIPLGGYVRLLGEDPGEIIAQSDGRRALYAKPLWQRYAIVIAGPAMNLILPFFIYFGHYATHRVLLPPVIGAVLPDQPAAQAGLLAGDRVEAIDGRSIRYWEELEAVVGSSPDQTLRFAIRRGPEAQERDVSPVHMDRPGTLGLRQGVGWIGVSPRFHLPVVGILDPSSPAAQAGLKTFDFITSVNGQQVSSWVDFERAVSRAGAAPLRLNYLRGSQSVLPFAHLEIQEPGVAVVIPVPVLDAVGHRRYETGIQSAEFFVFSVQPGSPADRIGLRRGDRILELDGKPILHWDLLRQQMATAPEKTFHIAWMSPGNIRREADFRQEVRFEVDTYSHQREERPVFGAVNRLAWKTEELVPIKNRFGYALSHSIERTGEMTSVMLRGFFQMVRGRMPLSTLGGPIMVGYVAGIAAEQGLDQYLWLLAVLSTNLGLLNFLPVPILDGGLLMFFTIELFKRRPPSARARRIAINVGLVMVGALTLLALKNDVVRYLLPR